MPDSKTDYLAALQTDASHSERYFLKSLETKTRQQIRLEEILGALHLHPARIADIACGAGSLSWHLSHVYSKAQFTLVDLNEQALELARRIAPAFAATVLKADASALPLPSDWFDLVFCWQTLLCIDAPESVFRELVRICRPGGRVFAASLFTEYDVDLHTRAVDHTRLSAAAGMSFPYVHFSRRTITSWTDEPITFHDFEIDIDIPREGSGLGTHTIRLEDGKRLQVSGGMLMNWKIVEVHKQ